MGVNQLKIVLSMLNEISEGVVPSAEDYELEEKQYAHILEAMQDDGLVKGIIFVADLSGDFTALTDDCRITLRGMEYLNENSKLMKTYKGLKEIREWLPF